MKYSVLVVDDELLIAKNIAKTIESIHPSFEVCSICSSGMEAWEYIEEHLPHIVFADIQMPEMTGLELVQKIQEKYPFIICAIISGYSDFEYTKQAINFHVTDYILKPINRDEVAKCLTEMEKKIQVQFPNLEQLTSVENNTRTPKETTELVKEYIHQNYMNPIDLSTICQNLGFSSSYLVKIFTKHTGITPSKYLRDYRLSIAKQLLSNPILPISAISTQVGFTDQFHFSKTFKTEFGISPSEFRQSL